MEPRCKFILFVTGQTSRSARAVTNLRRFCDRELRGECDCVIIDVLEHPQLAEEHKVLATPTLVKEYPPPIRRIIGDLSAIDLAVLGLNQQGGSIPR